MGQAEERNRLDLVGFCPQDLVMTAGGDRFSAGRLFFLLKNRNGKCSGNFKK